MTALLARPGKKIDWKNLSASPPEQASKEHTAELAKKDEDKLLELQELLYAAQTHFSFCVVLQGRDAAGKDGVVKHVY